MLSVKINYPKCKVFSLSFRYMSHGEKIKFIYKIPLVHCYRPTHNYISQNPTYIKQ